MSLGVAYQRERKLVLLGKALMALDRILAHADYLIAHVEERPVVVAERLRLQRAARSAVLRIEINDEPLAGIVGQLHLSALGIEPQYVRKFIAYIHNSKVCL